MTVKDLENSVLNPLATKDSLGRLRVGAASTVGQKGLQRSMALIEAGADLIVIDTAHGHSSHVLKSVEELRNKFPDIDIVAGNKLELSQRVGNMLAAFMEIICKNKADINYNYDKLMERILRAKEKEKMLLQIT